MTTPPKPQETPRTILEVYISTLRNDHAVLSMSERRDIANALEDAERRAQLEGWISVKDSMPRDNIRVFVLRADEPFFNPCIARHHYITGGTSWWQYEPDFISTIEPTHWMPLPAARLAAAQKEKP